jgi:hypothetical protein
MIPLMECHDAMQQFRYDMSWQRDPSVGTITSNYGSSRGLEIPLRAADQDARDEHQDAA